jgi:two-component system KDP operon response regulator KdpE
VRALVVEDEPRLAQTLEVNFRARGHDTDVATSDEQALELAARHHPDAVILDLGLPTLDRLDVVRELRDRSSVPIVVLSARGSEAVKVEALDLGADDYLAKPFGVDELLARIRAAVRRASPLDVRPVITTHDFTLDFVAMRAYRRGELVHLTPTQWHIIEALVRSTGQLVTHEQLLHVVWGPNHGTETNYLRVYMTHIRRLLEPDPSHPRYFITEPALGYRFELRIRDEQRQQHG